MLILSRNFKLNQIIFLVQMTKFSDSDKYKNARVVIQEIKENVNLVGECYWYDLYCSCWIPFTQR